MASKGVTALKLVLLPVLLAPVLLGLCACAATGTMTAINPAAQQTGAPSLDVVRYGLGHGAVKITMADGETLTGSYRTVSSGLSGAPSKPRGAPGGVPAAPMADVLFVSASGPRSQVACEGRGAPLHGAGTCRAPGGAEYRFVF